MTTDDNYNEFYDKEFKCNDSVITRADLESLPAPFCTKTADDEVMQIIIEYTDGYTRQALGIDKKTPLDFEDDRTSEIWWSELEEVVEFYEIPYYEDLDND